MTIREKSDDTPYMNEKIPFARLQLITHEGSNMGEVSKAQALALAEAAGLDLVLIAEQGGMELPVAKIMDYGKVSYSKKKQMNDAKKQQKTIQVKELQVRPKIGDHDLQTKLNSAVKFLLDGKRVKVTMMFRGREIAMKNERGTELFDKIEIAFDAAGLGKRLVQEKDLKAGQVWSRVYYLK